MYILKYFVLLLPLAFLESALGHKPLANRRVGKVWASQDNFGRYTDPITNATRDVDRFTLENEAGIQVQFISYGAAITSLKVPGRGGVSDRKDIVLGFDTMEGYLSEENPYFGAVIGRVSNRVANGTFTMDGKEYHVPLNDGSNSLHGGHRGFDKKLWEGKIVEGEEGPFIVFTLLSEDGDQGYPAALIASVKYELTADNLLKVTYEAKGNGKTPVAITNHSYFNLEGHEAAGNKLEGHWFQLNCDRYTPVDSTLIPTGEILPVEGSKFDFRSSKNLGYLLKEFPEGYDHNFCVNEGDSGKKEMRFVGRMQHEGSGRVLEIHSDQPGLQFYSGNFLPDPSSGEEQPVRGKGGAEYWKYGAFAVETQNYPNAVNYEHFPNPFLEPGETYKHNTIFKMFVVQ